MKHTWKRVVIGALLLALLFTGELGGVSAQAASGPSQAVRAGSIWDDGDSPLEQTYSYVYDFTYLSYTSTSITLSWMSGGNNTGFHVYRKCDYDNEYKLLGTVLNQQYAQIIFKDNTFVRGIRFTYRIVSYQRDEKTGAETEYHNFVSNSYLYRISQVKLASATRSGKTKAVIKWKKAGGVKGYEVFRKNSGSKYKRVKRIGSGSTLKWTARGVSKKKQTYFKVRAYVKYNGKYVYGEFSDTGTVVSLADGKILRKFRQLQRKYPSGKYWNHKGKSKWNSSTITNNPCTHYDVVASSCNYYHCPNGVIGYQCYGFAWKMSDLIYGRRAKIKNFRSYGKCRMGDVIRYSGHSVIITEKHSSYVVVGECNAGNTCIINWGRKVYRSELAGALYSRRY